MYYGIYNEWAIQRLPLEGERSILIRALEPSDKEQGIPYEIYNINQYVDVLELYFDDIAEINSNEDYQLFTIFNEDMARKLINFVTKNDFDEVIVHCSAGISRSPALMICVARILNMPEIETEILNAKIGDSKRFLPNKLVLSVFDKVFKEYKENKKIPV